MIEHVYNIDIYSYLNNDYQFRLRGEYINLYKIIEEQNKEKKKSMINYLNLNFLTLINKKFAIKTKKDYELSRLLKNEKI